MPATIRVLGIEVVQSIQNLRNEIPLLADKATMVRVYVRPSDLAADMPVTATLELRRTGDAGEETSEAESESRLQLRVDDIGDDDHACIAAQRRFLGRSFDFRLGPDQIKEGQLWIRLKRVTPTLVGDPEVLVQNSDYQVGVDFKRGPTLRVRAVGLRVRDPRTGDVHSPKPGHFESLRSYLERAFPVSKVEWSEITVDAAAGFGPPYSDETTTIADPGPVWQAKFDIACAQLMAIRAHDIVEGTDPRTHYYGMVYHPNDSFVGAVSNVPANARPDVVGIGPAVLEDGSSGAHELAHALGRLHPGFGEGQSAEDPDFPAQYRGRLSSSDSPEDHPHHGLDIGDSVERPRVLPFDEYYDLMTYRQPLWVSAYSYRGLLERLREEEELIGESAPKGASEGYLQIVGTYNIDKKEGTLSHVFPVRAGPLAAEEAERRVVVVAKDADGKTLFESNAELKLPAAADLPKNSSAFQVTVPAPGRLSSLDLKLDNQVVASRSLTSAPMGAGSLVPSVELLPPVTSPDDPYVLKITWPEPYDLDWRHTVQARLGRQKWQTIAVGITNATTEVLLDRRRFRLPTPPEPLTVQILRSSGFAETPIFEGRPAIGP
jgi:hypothetical protein